MRARRWYNRQAALRHNVTLPPGAPRIEIRLLRLSPSKLKILVRAGGRVALLLWVVAFASLAAACVSTSAPPPPPPTPTVERLRVIVTLLPPTVVRAAPPTAAPTLPPTPTPTPRPETGMVFSVLDGDTIFVQIGEQVVPVRYLLADAPDAGTPLNDPATQANRDLVAYRRVTLVRDTSNQDGEGRLLRYVYLDDGTLVNEAIVRRGWAQVVSFAPDRALEQRMLEAQDEAQDEALGIWASQRTPVTIRVAPLYTGPGLEYARSGDMALNYPLEIDAVAPDGSWYRLRDGRWIAAGDVVWPPDAPILNQNVSLVAVPSLFPTATPTPTGTPSPIATPTPVPLGTRAATTIVIEWINRRDGYVVLRNDATIPISLDDWKLVTEYSREICFLYGVMQPGERLNAWSQSGSRLEISCDFNFNLWDAYKDEPALLFAPNGHIVSRLDD